jgi:large subunit ribosomal protein L12
MEYVYAALLLHSAKKEISEKNLTTVLKSVGIEIDQAKVKTLISSLAGINIEELLSTSAPTAVPTAKETKPTEVPKEEKKKEEKVTEEEAAEGLGALFG